MSSLHSSLHQLGSPKRSAVLLALAALVCLPATPAAADTTTATTSTTTTTPPVLYQTGFEDGGTGGWSGDGGSQVANSTLVAHSGTHSLQVSNTAGYNRGGLLTLSSAGLSGGTWYDLKLPVRLAAGEPAVATSITPVSGVLPMPYQNFVWTADTAWSDDLGAGPPLEALWLHFQWDGSSPQLAFRVGPVPMCPGVQPASAPPTLFLDDVTFGVSAIQRQTVVIAGRCPLPTSSTTTTTSPTPDTVLPSDFEDGSTQGWSGSGGAELTNVLGQAHTGSHSLLVSGLSGYGQGAAVSIPAARLVPRDYYNVTVYARLPSGVAQDMRVVSPDGSGSVLWGNSRITGTGWASIWAVARWNGVGDGLQLRVEPLAACPNAPAQPLPYLLDDARVTNLGPTPPPLPGRPEPPCPLPTGDTTTTTTTTTTAATTTTATSPYCRVSYAVRSAWPGAFQASLRITNSSGTGWPSWTLTWTWPDGQVLSQFWPAGTVNQNGAAVTVTGPLWLPLPPGSTVDAGLIASWSGTNNPPAGFSINGHPCSLA